MAYLLPPTERNPSIIQPSDLICKETQRTYNQSVESPRLLARANDSVILLWQENEYITKWSEDFDFRGGGLIFIYGTLNSSPTDTLIGVHNNKDFTRSRGNYKGFGFFDDNHCYKDNGSPIAIERKNIPQRQHLQIEGSDLWCGRRVRLPSALAPGSIYTLYWVWEIWKLGQKTINTTCLDIEIIEV